MELSELSGRDHAAVSRQIPKLESLGLVARCPSPQGGQKILEELLVEWKSEAVRNPSRLLRKIADDAMDWVKTL